MQFLHHCHSGRETQDKPRLYFQLWAQLRKYCIWNIEISAVHQISCQLQLNVESCTLDSDNLSSSRRISRSKIIAFLCFQEPPRQYQEIGRASCRERV